MEWSTTIADEWCGIRTTTSSRGMLLAKYLWWHGGWRRLQEEDPIPNDNHHPPLFVSSPNVLNIYCYCGNSGVFEYADGGSLEDSIWFSEEQEWNATEKLVMAYQVKPCRVWQPFMRNVDGEGQPSISHTDHAPSQFVASSSMILIDVDSFDGTP